MTLDVDVVRLSPNHSPGQPSGKKVVVHATRSGVSMNPREFEGTLNYFARSSSQVSAHGLVGRDGRIARIVPDSQRAWHAGIHNPDMWGWELEQGVESDGFTIKQMESFAVVARHYVVEFGVEPQHITDINESGFIGHQETPQGISVGKSDPGSGFMWQAFIDSLEEGMAFTAEQQTEIRAIVREMDFNREDEDGKVWEPKRTLQRWLWELDLHRKDADVHSAGEAHDHEIPAGRTGEA